MFVRIMLYLLIRINSDLNNVLVALILTGAFYGCLSIAIRCVVFGAEVGFPQSTTVRMVKCSVQFDQLVV